MVIKKMFTCLCCALLAFCLTPAAQARGMTAAIATGPVVMNGQEIDSSTAEYPLLMYNNVTYVPMTYDLSRFMGLSTEWHGDTGTLLVDISREKRPYVPDTGHTARKGKVSVERAVNPVYVCGVLVDNTVEDHPLLVYNNTTYFPLTFDYLVNAFGCTYTWDAVNGLVITSPDRPEPPSDDVHTGTPALDEFLLNLNSRYRYSWFQYTGTLTDRRDGSVRTFDARVENTINSNYQWEIKLTAEPFVFFENETALSAIYSRYQNLTDDPVFQHNGGWAFSGTPVYGPDLNPPVPPEDLSKSETGYLARCFLDCQFSGRRAEKILSFSQESPKGQDEVTIWHLTVAFAVDGMDFTQYDADITVRRGFIRAIEISTENYTLRMETA